jgi:drug/metabolite transporter (DMT)-like permease
MSVAVQMLSAGALLLALSIARGERAVSHVSLLSVASLAHLVLFGSMLAYTALNHLLRTVRPALATSYAFVNPVVALALGAVLGGETVGRYEATGVALVSLGVIVVAGASRRAKDGHTGRVSPALPVPSS